MLEAKGVCGAILARVEAADIGRVPLGAAFPVVSCGRTYSILVHTVRPSVVSAMRMAWNRLRELDYRRIGVALIRHSPPVEDDFAREAAVLACRASIPAKQRIPPLFSLARSGEGLNEWVERYRPDAVLSFHIGLYWRLKELGIRIPDEVGFATLHRLAWCGKAPIQ